MNNENGNKDLGNNVSDNMSSISSNMNNTNNDALLDRLFMEKVIDSVSDPIFVKDQNHSFVLVNDAFCEFIGHKRESLTGKSDYEFFPKEQADIFWAKDKEVFDSEIKNVNEELLTTKSGNVMTIMTTKTIFVDDVRNKTLVGVIKDVTAVRSAEFDLIKKNEELEKFNNLAIDRELKMIELKNEISSLKKTILELEEKK